MFVTKFGLMNNYFAIEVTDEPGSFPGSVIVYPVCSVTAKSYDDAELALIAMGLLPEQDYDDISSVDHDDAVQEMRLRYQHDFYWRNN